MHTRKPLEKKISTSSPLFLQKPTFYERSHIYTYGNVPLTTSVTSLAHKFEHPFFPDETIAGMKAGRNQEWPREEYVIGLASFSEWTPNRGALAVNNGKTVSVVHPFSVSTEEVNTVRNLLSVACRKGESISDDTSLFSYSRAYCH